MVHSTWVPGCGLRHSKQLPSFNPASDPEDSVKCGSEYANAWVHGQVHICVCAVACDVGNFSTVFDLGTECQTCPSGFYTNEIGQSICKLCNPGKYQDEVGKPECKSCKSGLYQSDEGKTTCEKCFAGLYSDQVAQEGEDTCLNCPNGQFSELAAFTCPLDATTCPQGRYASGTDTVCDACPDGSYNSETGKTSVAACKNNCVAGSYITSDKSECKVCAAGQWQDQNGQSSCKICTKGKTNMVTGQITESKCLSCPAGQAARNNKSPCTYCKDGLVKTTEDAYTAEACSCCSCTSGTAPWFPADDTTNNPFDPVDKPIQSVGECGTLAGSIVADSSSVTPTVKKVFNREFADFTLRASFEATTVAKLSLEGDGGVDFKFGFGFHLYSPLKNILSSDFDLFQLGLQFEFLMAGGANNELSDGDSNQCSRMVCCEYV